MLPTPPKNTHLKRGHNRFGTASLLYNGGGSGGGTASVSTGAGQSSSDSGAPSTLYGGSCVAPAATCSTSAVEPTGLTARFPNACALGVSASAPGQAIDGPEVSPPPPRSAGLLADTPGTVSSMSRRWSRGPRPISPSSL